MTVASLPLRSALLCAALACFGAHAQPLPPTAPAPIPASNAPPVELQTWEKRRIAFMDMVKGVRSGDAIARKDLERTVRSFEQSPFALTPLEAMDLIGSIFVPQAGVEKLLPLIAAQAALGLYDMHRFGSSLAMAELLEGERFLSKPLTLAGAEQAAKSRAYFADNPEKAAVLVREGLRLADMERASPMYDNKWVTSLGRCEPEAVNCPKHQIAPREEWDQLWLRATTRVIEYYRVELKPAAVAEPVPAASGAGSNK